MFPNWNEAGTEDVMNPKKQRVLISNATIVSMDPKLGVIERGDLLIEDDRIAPVGLKIARDNAELIDQSEFLPATAECRSKRSARCSKRSRNSCASRRERLSRRTRASTRSRAGYWSRP
jgi:dihydroorotase-like cyclic amidohydrolase